MAQRFLIVEGPDDAAVVNHICLAHRIILKNADEPAFEPPFVVEDKGGFPRLRKALGVMFKSSALTHIGVIVDADERVAGANLSVRWCSIRDLLREHGYACPDGPDPAGIVLEQDERPRVGVWIMPDNVSVEGRLETFVSSMAPAGNQLWTWAQAALTTVPECEERFEEKDREKALVHTYLAVQKEPGSPMGGAIRQCYFDAQSASAVHFIDWLRKIFEV